MKTIAEEIRHLVMVSPFLEEGLSRGVLNYSAAAREIRPQVEASLLKPVSVSAILMALKRLAATLETGAREEGQPLRVAGDLTVRSHLSEFTFVRSDTMVTNQKCLLDELETRTDAFVTFTQGVFETTIIVSASLKPRVAEIFASETRVSQLDDLSAVVMRFPGEAAGMPGVHYPILRQLAWKQVSIIEIISTFTELTLVMRRDQIERAFSTLLNYFDR